MPASSLGEVLAVLDRDHEVELLLNQIADSRGRLREILLARETQLRMAARLGGLGAWMLSVGPLRFVPSPEWREIHDVPPGQRVSLCGVLRMVARDCRKVLLDGLRTCSADGQPFSVVISARTATGRAVHLRMIAEASYDEQGRVACINGACQDVTEQVAREEELAAHRHHLQELVEQRTADLQTFAYALAHDVRAPISAMAGFAQVLGERVGPNADPRIAHYIERIRSNGLRAEALVDGILGLISVLQAPIDREPVDLSAIARDTLDHLRATEPERAALCEVDAGLRACGDRRLLMSVLQNLLGNAWKFTRCRAQARIHVGSAKPGTFFVRDNGVGFDPARAGDLFKPLRRLHGRAEFEGTGIGLATACRIVQRHGGTMWAEAVEGEGATFWFTLPQPAPQTAPVAP